MTTQPRELINEIRSQYMGVADMPRQSLASSIKTLADDLYAKDAHFIFELIQNAEDNEYHHSANPRLRFEVRMLDIDDWTGPVLIIRNNEIGFQPQHVKAICKVGQSTKDKAQGYIGEKGIGFKSVFRVTDSPFIFSNGYRFCLPEHDAATDLGYIVPTWVEQPPDGMDDAWTTSIFLPLRGKNYSYKKVINDLLEIAPETLLFLQRLTALEIVVDLPEEWHEIIVEKHTELGSGRSRLVELTHQEITEDGERVSLDARRYWLTEVEYPRPPEIEHEKRVGIERRVVSVAIPLNPAEQQDKLFAYLPVWEKTGIPFLINADFLLVSSREGIREDEDWNQWLRDCVADTYVTALDELVRSPSIELETRCMAYASIPLETHRSFLDPLVTSICARLQDTNCVLVEGQIDPVKPSQARLCYQNFRTVLNDATHWPQYFLSNVHLVTVNIERFQEQARAIGVKRVSLEDVLRCLSDTDWLAGQSMAWFVQLYRYLNSQKFTKEQFVGMALVPVTLPDGADRRLSSDQEQAIYYTFTEQDLQELKHAPYWLRKLVAVVQLDPALHEQLRMQRDGEPLLEWMNAYLSVYGFSIENFCVDIVTALGQHHVQLTDIQLIEATRFLVEHSGENCPWQDLIVILTDGTRMRVKEVTGTSVLVVPATLDPEAGWQHIWASAQDRRYFQILADEYTEFGKQWLDKLGAVPFPPIRQIDLRPDQVSSASDPLASELLSECRMRSTASRTASIRISVPETPSGLRRLVAEPSAAYTVSASLLKWLTHLLPPTWGHRENEWCRIGLCAKGTYHYYGKKSISRESEILRILLNAPWLPSSRGYVIPTQAFLQKQSTKESLGDSVPYFQGSLPVHVLQLLGVSMDVTTDALLGILRAAAQRNESNVDQVKHIYAALAARTVTFQGEIRTRFRQEPLTLARTTEGTHVWAKSDECLWEDVGDTLGDDFVFLATEYSNLRQFFVDTLGIKVNADPKVYADLWLSLQTAPATDPSILRGRMERICRALRPIAQQPSADRPEWWREFASHALIYTDTDKFVGRHRVVLADDGELRDIFRDANVEFAWRPGKDAFEHWRPLFDALQVPLLSAHVAQHLSDTVERTLLPQNRFVTPAAIQMIAAWLREKRPPAYARLIEARAFSQLISLREALTPDEVPVTFHLSTGAIDEKSCVPYPNYWSKTESLLLYHENPDKMLLAKTLARSLFPGADKDFAHWIELVLSEQNTARLKHENWSVPQEILDLFTAISTSSIEEESAHTLPAQVATDAPSAPGPSKESASNAPPVQQIPDIEHQPDEPAEDPEDQHLAGFGKGTTASQSKNEADSAKKVANNRRRSRRQRVSRPKPPPQEAISDDGGQVFDFAGALMDRFNRQGVSELNGDQPAAGSSSMIVRKPERRSRLLADDYRRNRSLEPLPTQRRRTAERTLLEPPNERVRVALHSWYQGKCQICGETWPKRDGQPFFAAAYLVERHHARWLDDPANAICLCAKHFAQWRYAAVEAPLDVIEQIQSLRLVAEGGDGDLSLWFTLLGKDVAIVYDERHLLALRQLLDVTQEEDEVNATPRP